MSEGFGGRGMWRERSILGVWGCGLWVVGCGSRQVGRVWEEGRLRNGLGICAVGGVPFDIACTG